VGDKNVLSSYYFFGFLQKNCAASLDGMACTSHIVFMQSRPKDGKPDLRFSLNHLGLAEKKENVKELERIIGGIKYL
jgi:hypothetical protein